MNKIIINGSEQYNVNDISCIFVEKVPAQEREEAFKIINERNNFESEVLNNISAERKAKRPIKRIAFYYYNQQTKKNEKVIVQDSVSTEEIYYWNLFRKYVKILQEATPATAENGNDENSKGIKTIEFKTPTMVVNYNNIATDEEGVKAISLAPIVEETEWKTKKTSKLVAKIKKIEQKIKMARKNKLKKGVYFTIKFNHGLVIKHSNKQPGKLTAFLFDRVPKDDETTRFNEAEYEYKRVEAENEAKRQARNKRRKHIAKIFAETIKKQRKEREKQQKALEEEAKKQAKQIVEENENIK